jgi:hypothetical protein
VDEVAHIAGYALSVWLFVLAKFMYGVFEGFGSTHGAPFFPRLIEALLVEFGPRPTQRVRSTL